jgi:hypothetical protein
MSHHAAHVSALILLICWPSKVEAVTMAPDQAGTHLGETATICGTVASTNFAQRAKGKPTFLDFEKPYPNQTFTVLIWGEDRAKFGAPEISLLEKHVCATGQIQIYRGRPEIIVHDSGDLKQE